jgi:hypothetical protein
MNQQQALAALAVLEGILNSAIATIQVVKSSLSGEPTAGEHGHLTAEIEANSDELNRG